MYDGYSPLGRLFNPSISTSVEENDTNGLITGVMLLQDLISILIVFKYAA